MMMLPSRSARIRSHSVLRSDTGTRRVCAGCSAAGAGPSGEVSPAGTVLPDLRRRTGLDRNHLDFGGGSLVAALAFDIRKDGFFVDELQARVGFRGPRQRSRVMPLEQLQDRQEALQVGLLVDREFQEA